MKNLFFPSLCAILLTACGQPVIEIDAEKRTRMAWEEQMIRGKPEGYYQVGLHYLNGIDGEKDLTKGTYYLCEAAHKNYAPAMMALGDFFYDLSQSYGIAPGGDFIDRTPSYDALAYAWYDIAARNSTQAQVNYNDKTEAARSQAKRKALDLFEHFELETTQLAKNLADAFPHTLCIYYKDRVEPLPLKAM